MSKAPRLAASWLISLGILISPGCATLTRDGGPRIPVTSSPPSARINVYGIEQGMIPLPSDSLTQGASGANLTLTLKDGRRFGGELISVKRDSLLLLNPVGKDESVAVTEISSLISSPPAVQVISIIEENSFLQQLHEQLMISLSSLGHYA